MQKNDFKANFLQNISSRLRFLFGRGVKPFAPEPSAASETTAVPDGEPASGSPFLSSLEGLTPDDIAPPEPKKKLTAYDIVYGVLRRVLLAVSIGVFCWSVYSIIHNLVAYKIAEDLYSDLAADIGMEEILPSAGGRFNYSPPSQSSAVSQDFKTSYVSSVAPLGSGIQMTVYNPRFEKMKAKLNTLSIQNPDTYGWISIEGTAVNYPIVQAEDNDYYLDHAFTGATLPAGSIFADYRNYKTLLENFHLILYGHNMKNGLMFNTVVKYLEEDFFNENPYIEIFTPEGIYTYEVFAVYKTRYDYDYIRTGFMDYDEFIEYAYKMKANSLYARDDIEFVEGDRMLTLSTCTNGLQSERYALQAKLIKIEN